MNVWIKEKATFAIGFLAAATAISGFKAELTSHSFIFAYWQPTYFLVGEIFLVLLGFAGYLYAVQFIWDDYIRSERFQWVIRMIEFLSHASYAVAILLPAICFFGSIATYAVQTLRPNITSQLLLTVIEGLTAALIGGPAGLLVAKYSNRRVRAEQDERIYEMIERIPLSRYVDHMKQAERFYDEKFYVLSITESGNAAKSFIEHLLQQKSFLTFGYSFTEMARLAEDRGLISSADHELIKKIRRHGAIALHSMGKSLERSEKLAKREALFSIKNLKTLEQKYL